MPDNNSTTAATRHAITPETAQAVKTSVLAALAVAGKPLGTTIGDTVLRSVHDAIGHDFGIAGSVMKAFGTPKNLGLANVISAGAAPLRDLTPAFGIDHRALSTIKAIEPSAGAAPLHGLTAAFGTGESARTMADTLTRAAGLHNRDTNRTLRGLAIPVISAADHFAQMRSAIDTIMPADGWAGSMAGARAAIYTAIPAMPDPAVWSHLSGAFTGHNSGLAHHLAGLAGPRHNSFAELIRSSQRTIREAFGLASPPHTWSWMDDLVRESTDAIAEMMRSLWPLADGGMQAAQLALRAAMRIVGLLERGAPQAPAAVRDFLINWLGFRYVGSDLINSATLVLMKVASWLPDNVLTLDFDPRAKLRRLTLDEHRAANRLSTDLALQVHHVPLLSLDQPVTVSEQPGAPTVLRDLVADKAAADPTDLGDEEFTDPRFLRLWGKITDTERAMLRAKGQPGVTWASAAVDVGQRPEAGESLRRKLKRLAARETSLGRTDSRSAQAG